MKHLSVITLLCALAFAAPAQTAITPVTPAVSSLPAYTVGTGPSWERGSTAPLGIDVTVGVHIGQTQWYSWTNISTPIVTNQAPGAPPVASTLTTGGAWVPIQSSSGAVSLVFIVQAGFSTIEATSTVAPAFTGSLGVAFRLGKSHVYLMPYAKTSNATTSSTSGALATAIFQPGVQIIYGFGGK